MSADERYIIIGAGQAGGWAANTLRECGFDGTITLIGEEPYLPYERPPLSKGVLLGEETVESTYFWPSEAYEEWKVELKLSTQVARIHPSDHTVELEGGETLPYTKLMIATGTRARPLPVPGSDLDGVHYLRSIDDTLAIQKALRPDSKVVVVGGGWIGLETAAAVRKLGGDVTVVEAMDRLCARALEQDISDYLLKAHQDHGVTVLLGVGVEAITGDGNVSGVALNDGTTIDCDLIVVGIGAIANQELAEEAGLAVDNGIIVDEHGRTSGPDIFAAGDVTNHPNALLGRNIRLESWENAQNQAIAAAKAMMDQGEPYAEVPWFWSDQYDINIQLVGLPTDWDQAVMRGDPKDGSFMVFYLKGSQIEGAASINNPRDIRMAKRLMTAKKDVDPAQLADPEVKLQKLVKG